MEQLERVVPRLIEDEVRDAFLDYAMSVIVARALPDVRDGLKPVQRRILYAMHELGLLPNRPYRKSAVSSARCWGSTIRMAMPRSTRRWCGWHSPGRCATRSLTGKATSVP
jgi:hypothetical protein